MTMDTRDDAWVACAGPAIGPESALRRLADEPTLLALIGCGLGASYLVWGDSAEPAASAAGADLAAFFRALPAQDLAAAGTDRDRGWAGLRGGYVVQCDYEAPAAPPRAWSIGGFAAWDASGGCRLHARGAQRLGRMARDLARPELACAAPSTRSELVPAWNAAVHVEKVEAIKRLIADGDIYQANLTLPFTAPVTCERADVAVFLALTAASPAPFSALMRAPGSPSVVSHSPECFLEIDGERIASLPIKGTRRRIAGSDARTRAELLASAKDRAELAMIVDLVRHDLGRVAAVGSVTVEEPARVLDLPALHHLEAVVSARLRPGCDLAEAIAASFPAGSITGAPKIRAMQVIAGMEGRPRGAYCGTFGWFTPGVGCRLAVAIRTLTIDARIATIHAGSGIVADSDPLREWDETGAKAEAMAAAVGARLP